MPSCVMRWCTNYTPKRTKEHGITYHKFPQDELKRHEWIKIVREQRSEGDWMPTKVSTICSEHFKDDLKYSSGKGYTRLKSSAVPFIKKQDNSSNICVSPTSLINVDSEMSSIFDSPRKYALKKKVRRLVYDKKKLQKKNKILKQQNTRLKKKITSMKNILYILKKKNYISEQQSLELNLKSEVLDLFTRIQKQNKRQKRFRAKYPPSLRKFALTLNFYSPAAYKYVRRVFDTALPHPRVLGKWYENTTISPGFTQQSFDILKEKSQLVGKRLLCTLVADEMALRHQTVWTGKKTDGLVDFGCGPTSSTIATQAYVLILVCLNECWKIPVGYFFVNSLTGETRADVIRSCLIKCYESGVDVIALTFDGCPSNVAAANLLGCQFNNVKNLKTTFKHPSCDTEIAIFLDPCHMIKLVRNTFEAKRVIFDNNDKTIRWQHLLNLQKLQKNEGLNFANKLTARHIHFRNEVMKVKLATQLLSRSVASALILCGDMLTGTKFKDTEATVEFITIFNSLFDVFNSRARDISGLKKPICQQTYQDVLTFLEKAKCFILSLRIYSKTRRVKRQRITIHVTKKPIVECKSKTGFLGFLICIESLKHLYHTLVENNVLQYIATYRLSQDHIEMFFGLVRRHGGYNNNPNLIQFKGIYKKLVNHLELRSGFNGNCIPLEHFPILTCSSALLSLNRSSERQSDYDVDDKVQNYSTTSDTIAQNNVDILVESLYSEHWSSMTNQIVGYISGWIARKLNNNIKCETCIAELYTCNKLWFHKLITIKDIGGLYYSSNDLFEICIKCEKAIRTHITENGVAVTSSQHTELLKNRVLKSFIDTDVFSSECYLEHCRRQPPTLNHRLHLIRLIIEKYLNVRMHYAHKNNPAINKINKRQKRNKLNLFEGT